MNNAPPLCSWPGRGRLIQPHSHWLGIQCSRLTLTNWHLGPQRKARHPVLSTFPTPRQATTQRSGVRAEMTSEALGLGARAQNPTPGCPCSGVLTRPQAPGLTW